MEQSVFACYLAGWKKCFVYQGTASRKEFWSFILGNLLIGVLLHFLSIILVVVYTGSGRMALDLISYVVFPMFILFPLLLLLAVTALGIRRMHDIGKSGWWFGGVLVLNLIILPVIQIGVIYFFINSRGYDGAEVAGIINISLILMGLVFTLWLCCQPTKIVSSSSSPDVTN